MASTAETLHMSIGDVELKFNQGQLVIMSVIQEINHEDLKGKIGKGGGRGKQLNRGKTPEERNANAFKHL